MAQGKNKLEMELILNRGRESKLTETISKDNALALIAQLSAFFIRRIVCVQPAKVKEVSNYRRRGGYFLCKIRSRLIIPIQLAR